MANLDRNSVFYICGVGGFAGGGDGSFASIDLNKVSDDAFEKISRLVEEFKNIDKSKFMEGRDVYSYAIHCNSVDISLYPLKIETDNPNFPKCITDLFNILQNERKQLGQELEMPLRFDDDWPEPA